MGATHPGGADHGGVATTDGRHLVLTAQLAPPVDGLWIGGVPFHVGPVQGPVEDIVGGDIEDVGAHPTGRLGHMTGTHGVDRERGIGV